MEITRRNFFKLGAVFGGGLLLPACAKESVLKPAEETPPPKGDETSAASVCGLCPAGCGLKVRLVDGKAVGLSGSPDHPVNQGGLCPQGMAGLQDAYHPDRLTAPLSRIGHRGSGRWKEISWEEALARVSEALNKARAGALPLLAITRAGHDVHQEVLGELVRLSGGKLVVAGFPAGEPPREAFKAMQGAEAAPWSAEGLRLLVSFGQDWLQTNASPVEIQRRYAELRRGNGPRARLVQVESRFSVSAAKADAWIPVRPGTEGVLALAVLHQLIADGAENRAFLESRATGFERLRSALKPFAPQRASAITGAPEKSIRLLASDFASLRPAAAITNRGPLLTQLAVHAINAVLGNIGPGKAFSPGGNLSDLASDALPAEPNPGVLLVDRSNPLFTAPAAWKAAFHRADFVVAVHSHLADTAAEADLVLPCRSALESARLSLHSTLGGETVVNAAPPCLKPLGDAKDAGEIFSALIAARGQGGPASFDDYLKKRVSALGARELFDEKSPRRWRRLAAPARAGFATGSRRFDFEPLAEALSKFREPAEDSEFPLYLQIFTPLAFQGGEGAHLPYLLSLAGVQSQEMWVTWAEIHPETAAKGRISDGDKVWIASRRGKFAAKARIVPWAAPEVVSVPLGLGHTAYGRWAKGVGANPMDIAEAETTRVSLSRA